MTLSGICTVCGLERNECAQGMKERREAAGAVRAEARLRRIEAFIDANDGVVHVYDLRAALADRPNEEKYDHKANVLLHQLEEENERLRKLTDYLRNGEVNVDEQEREYARLGGIEKAAKDLAAINLHESWRLDGHAAESYVAAVFPRWVALRAALARPVTDASVGWDHSDGQTTEEKLTPNQELMYAEDGYDQPTEEK